MAFPKSFFPKKERIYPAGRSSLATQYTSEPEYWQRAQEIVDAAPSTLNLIYPEVYLNEKNPEIRIADIRKHMDGYLSGDLFEKHEKIVYVERQTGATTRKGLMVCLDLEHYDFRKGSTSAIRATEGTILERIPPRVRIREGAPLELPHIMILIDDPENTVIGPVSKALNRHEKLYDFELMMGSGRLAGYKIGDPSIEKGVIEALTKLAGPDVFSKKYGLPRETPVLLYAVGDGNHSLATAKTIWEKAKEAAPDKPAIMDSPLRYAMIELVNLHDPALVFEPIHRVLFEIAPDRYLLEEMKEFFSGRVKMNPVGTLEEMKSSVDTAKTGIHKIGVIHAGGFGVLEVAKPDANLPVGTLQTFLDGFMKSKGAKEIDYVHGTDAVAQLGKKTGNMGFYLPAINKADLFKTVILDGALPRKTFSMGEAWEKRFYMEARKIV